MIHLLHLEEHRSALLIPALGQQDPRDFEDEHRICLSEVDRPLGAQAFGEYLDGFLVVARVALELGLCREKIVRLCKLCA